MKCCYLLNAYIIILLPAPSYPMCSLPKTAKTPPAKSISVRIGMTYGSPFSGMYFIKVPHTTPNNKPPIIQTGAWLIWYASPPVPKMILANMPKIATDAASSMPLIATITVGIPYRNR